eukprot:Rmarinus@m.12780
MAGVDMQPQSVPGCAQARRAGLAASRPGNGVQRMGRALRLRTCAAPRHRTCARTVDRTPRGVGVVPMARLDAPHGRAAPRSLPRCSSLAERAPCLLVHRLGLSGCFHVSAALTCFPGSRTLAATVACSRILRLANTYGRHQGAGHCGQACPLSVEARPPVPGLCCLARHSRALPGTASGSSASASSLAAPCPCYGVDRLAGDYGCTQGPKSRCSPCNLSMVPVKTGCCVPRLARPCFGSQTAALADFSGGEAVDSAQSPCSFPDLGGLAFSHSRTAAGHGASANALAPQPHRIRVCHVAGVGFL